MATERSVSHNYHKESAKFNQQGAMLGLASALLAVLVPPLAPIALLLTVASGYSWYQAGVKSREGLKADKEQYAIDQEEKFEQKEKINKLENSVETMQERMDSFYRDDHVEELKRRRAQEQEYDGPGF